MELYKVKLSLFFLVIVITEISAAQHEIPQMTASRNNNACITDGNTPIVSFEIDDLLIPEKIRKLEEYQKVIKSLEEKAGAYNYDLLPELIGLGLLSSEAGEHADAVSAVNRAVSIIRINEGLYSPNQLPLLEIIINGNIANSNWEEVADAYDLMLWLNKRNYSENDQRLLPILKRIRQWHIDAYNKETGRSLEDHFSIVETLYKQALNILKKCTSDERMAMCFFYKGCCADFTVGNSYCPADK